MRTVSRILTGGGFPSVSLHNNPAVQAILVPFLGTQHHQNFTARIALTPYSAQPCSIVLAKQNIDPVTLSPRQCSGVVYPSACTQLAIVTGRNIRRRHARAVMKTLPDFDGSFDTLAPVDYIGQSERRQAGGILTLRMVYNLISALPIMQQQAALNFALLAFSSKNPDLLFAQLANEIAGDVGSKWQVLPSETMSFGVTNTAASGTGLVHLYRDVPDSLAAQFKRLTKNRKLSESDALEVMQTMGSSCELAKEAALGALRGTQHFMDLIGRELPMMGSFELGAARRFFTEEGVEGGIKTRDSYVLPMLEKTARDAGIVIREGMVRKAYESGAVLVRPQALEVREIAENTCDSLAIENVRAAIAQYDDLD